MLQIGANPVSVSVLNFTGKSLAEPVVLNCNPPVMAVLPFIGNKPKFASLILPISVKMHSVSLNFSKNALQIR